VFERLDDADVRTAGTTYLMYRGRHRHEPSRESTMTRIAATLMPHAVMGPRELFYADIFASRQTGCRSNLGMPGVRDRHSGCVGAYLAEHDLYDFMLLSLPDNDWRSHRSGPDGQQRSLALADIQLARVLGAAGGLDAFLDEHAVIVLADHSQAPVRQTVALQPAFAELGVLAPATRWRQARAARERPHLAICPSQRAAMLYVLDEEERARSIPQLAQRALGIEGVELAMWLSRDPHGAPAEAILRRPDGSELRFAPGGDVRDGRGRTWRLDGPLAVLGAQLRDGRLHAPEHPDALARVWAALNCANSGDVLLSAARGYEFLDLGGQAHVGGGSHGSLRAEDSLGAAIVCGIEPLDGREQWAIGDFAGLAERYFA
jgi:hypothetical protein